MNILIFGANGQLGSDLVKQLSAHHHVKSMTHQDVDLGELTSLQSVIVNAHPDIIINTAAFHHVEQCENDPEKATLINVSAPKTMAETAIKIGARFIHFSTDYVFNGNQRVPYIESDETLPLNVYGKSKREGEKAVLNAMPAAVVMRVSGLYGSNPCRAKNGLNFVQLMLKLAREKGEVKVVDDEFVSPTYTKNIAEQVEKILDSEISGIVHATSEGQCSWNEFAAEIFSQTGTQVNLMKANSTDFPAKVPRPQYSVLENKKLKNSGINVMQPWQDALKRYLSETSQN